MNNNKWYTWLALVLAVWFALTSWFWAWLAAIFISYPFGAIALILYFIGKRSVPDSKLNKSVLIILILGWIVSILAFVIMVTGHN